MIKGGSELGAAGCDSSPAPCRCWSCSSASRSCSSSSLSVAWTTSSSAFSASSSITPLLSIPTKVSSWPWRAGPWSHRAPQRCGDPLSHPTLSSHPTGSHHLSVNVMGTSLMAELLRSTIGALNTSFESEVETSNLGKPLQGMGPPPPAPRLVRGCCRGFSPVPCPQPVCHSPPG